MTQYPQTATYDNFHSVLEKKSSTTLTFPTSEIFIINLMTMKRQYRQLNQETKDKIRSSATGRAKTEQHKQRIRESMLRYWATIPDKPQAEDPQ